MSHVILYSQSPIMTIPSCGIVLWFVSQMRMDPSTYSTWMWVRNLDSPWKFFSWLFPVGWVTPRSVCKLKTRTFHTSTPTTRFFDFRIRGLTDDHQQKRGFRRETSQKVEREFTSNPAHSISQDFSPLRKGSIEHQANNPRVSFSINQRQPCPDLHYRAKRAPRKCERKKPKIFSWWPWREEGWVMFEKRCLIVVTILFFSW